MCGIFGIASRQRLAPLSTGIAHGVAKAAHRGPDDQGFAAFAPDERGMPRPVYEGRAAPDDSVLGAAGLLLAHTRLSILDLTPMGHQPMRRADGRAWITYNGEIYNYVELRAELEQLGCRFRSSGDTEVILEAYRAWGSECVQRFNGIWAFALLDVERRLLFCSRDRFGVKPLHYCLDAGCFVFGSELKQLTPFTARRVNRQAAYEYLVHGSADHLADTFLTGVKRLLPGHSLSFDLASGELQVTRYYAPRPALDTGISMGEASRKFRELLTDSVRLQLRSDVEVGSCLSGGLDSSSIVCTMNTLLRERRRADVQRTFSSHFEEPEANELSYMKEVISATGVKAHFVYPTPGALLEELDALVRQQDEPFGSTSIFAQWCVYRLAHEHGVKVMLDGQGADEQLAGYVPFFHVYFLELLLKRRPIAMARELASYWYRHRPALGQLMALYTPRLWRLLHGSASQAAQPAWLNPALARDHAQHDAFASAVQTGPYDPTEKLNNLLYQMTMSVNLPALLRYADRNAMAFSVEARVPFLDHRLVEFVFSLPACLKIGGGYTKRVQREGVKGLIPENIRLRTTKLGFATPERRWQRTWLRPLVDEAMRSERLAPFIDPQGARAALARIDAADAADFLPWRWVNLDKWLDVYDVA
jgi:asparagine synthase (glutamine-hydrolysing)